MSHRAKERELSTLESRLLVRDFLMSLDCPRSLTCWLLFASGGEAELVQLVNLSCDPSQYRTAVDFAAAHAATKFLAKTDDLKTGIDKAGVALEAAIKAEVRCSDTNRRLRSELFSQVTEKRNQTIMSVRAKIAKILGPVPDLSSLPGGWSKGRTSSSSGPDLSPYKKYGSRLDVTASALRYALRELRDSPIWGAAVLNADGPVSLLKEAFTVIPGNVMLTVPKNAKTDRVICYEPHMNIWLQLKVGNYMRRRLRQAGVDLDDQSVNQRRARLASRTGHLATLDLRGASDTVSTEVIDQLLPIDWVCLLHDLRSVYTKWPDGAWKRNEKFSSMGNGFTFELESLLFYAICSSQSTDVSVYGDDLIVPTGSFDDCVEALEAFGFEINTSKSFSYSPFRESCGDDSYLGFCCTPVYLRTLPKVLEDVVKLHNAVLAFSQRVSLHYEYRFVGILMNWRRRFPHLLGPPGFGDGHYHVGLSAAMAAGVAVRARNWVEGWWFHTITRVYVKGVHSVDGMNYAQYYRALSAGIGPKRPRKFGGLMAADMDRRFFKYRRVRILASLWPETLVV